MTHQVSGCGLRLCFPEQAPAAGSPGHIQGHGKHLEHPPGCGGQKAGMAGSFPASETEEELLKSGTVRSHRNTGKKLLTNATKDRHNERLDLLSALVIRINTCFFGKQR